MMNIHLANALSQHRDSGETSADSKNNDYLSFQANVDAHLALRKLICQGTEASNDPHARSPMDSSFAETFGFTPER